MKINLLFKSYMFDPTFAKTTTEKGPNIPKSKDVFVTISMQRGMLFVGSMKFKQKKTFFFVLQLQNTTKIKGKKKFFLPTSLYSRVSIFFLQMFTSKGLFPIPETYDEAIYEP